MPAPSSDSPLSAPPATTTRRFVAAGEPATLPDGTVDCGLECQMQRAWIKLIDQLSAAGFELRHLQRATVSVTQGGERQHQLYRLIRDRMLAGHTVASSYLHVDALAAPGRLVEIEAEAVKD